MSNLETEFKKVSPSSLFRHLIFSINSNTPSFIWGSPGIGKSDIIKSVARFLGFHVEDIRLSQIESIDLRGLPTKSEHNNEAIVKWAKPDFLVRAEKARLEENKSTIFFFDELNQAFPSTQAAAYQLILDRQIGSFKLHPDDRIIAAGNLETDGGVTTQMATPLANRLIHYYLEVNVEEWLSWGMANNVHPFVISYIERNKDKLHSFTEKEMSGEEKAYRTPRSWTFVSNEFYQIEKFYNNLSSLNIEEEDFFVKNSFNTLNKDTMLYDYEMAAAASVGSGSARELIGFIKTSFDMPKPEQVFSGSIKEFDFGMDKSKEYLMVNSCLHTLSIENKEIQKEKKAKEESIKKPSPEFKIKLDKFYKKLENYILFINNNISEELCIYSIKTKMIDQLNIQPHPDYISDESFNICMDHFNRCKKEALEEEKLNTRVEEEII